MSEYYGYEHAPGVVETTNLEGPDWCKMGMITYDVSAVRKMWPWNILGRRLGGCEICGTLWPVMWYQCCDDCKSVCQKCHRRYVEIKAPTSP